MVETYSLKKAAVYSALGFGAMGLAGAFQAAVHLKANHFDSFLEAFTYVAQPGPCLIAAGASIVAGAGIEFIRWYNRKLDLEGSAHQKPARNQRTHAP